MKQAPLIVVQLVHISGPFKGQIQEFTAESITLGRSPDCSLVFPPDLTSISRRHSELVREGNAFKVVDRSTNGTFLNGKRVTESPLRNGDVIMLSEGGPKVSFLSEVREGVPQPEPVVAAPQPPAPTPPQPLQAAPPVQQERPVPVAPPPQREVPRPAAQTPPPPVAEARPSVDVQRVAAPFVIQYGAMIKTFRELPITLGRNLKCEFAIDLPQIADYHCQFFFAQGQYWIKDLTGAQTVRVNSQPLSPHAMLKPEDLISLSISGPQFRFLGDGRVAEVESAPEPPPQAASERRHSPAPSSTDMKEEDGLVSKIKKMFGS